MAPEPKPITGNRPPPLPAPATVTDLYLAAIVDELRALRAALQPPAPEPEPTPAAAAKSPPLKK